MLSSNFSCVFVIFPKEEDIGYLVVRPELVFISAVNTDCFNILFGFYNDVKEKTLFLVIFLKVIRFDKSRTSASWLRVQSFLR